MLRRASTALFCAFALVAPAYGQEIFVPRELKATAVHPPKPKEVVRRAEPVTDADSKPAKESAPSTETPKPKAAKPDIVTVKTQKPAAKEKSPAATDDASRKTAKVDTTKEKSDRPAVPKDPPATKNVAKTEPAKEKKDKPAPAKEKSDSDLPVIKVEKATVAKEPATKAVAKTEIAKAEPSKEKTDKPAAVKEKSASESAAKTTPAKTEATVAKTEKAAPPKDQPSHEAVAKNDSVKVETITAKTEKPAVKDKPATVAASRSLNLDKSPLKEAPPSKTPAKTEAAKPEVTVAKSEKPAAVKEKEKPAPAPAKPPITKSEAMIARVEPAPPREGPANPAKMLPMKGQQVFVPSQKDPPQIIPTGSLDMGFTKIADGFDFPVGKPEAEGYYKARGFRAGGHVGEDWDGVRGGDTDLGDPIYCAGDGIVVFARDVHLGWGNVIIVRHAYRENGNVRYVDSLYGHLNSMLVSRGQRVSRGQQIATMGTAHGQYDAHLHFEIRKNLEIGMSRSKFGKDFSNYYDPTQFINSHRHLSGGGANYKVAMNTFTHDWTYHFDKNRDFGPRKRSTGESSAALRKVVTSR
ncbi:MAG: peptidoglycan DD-metalloendopeptidase family protein [Verrucomicrobiota bacterium]|nr:peptidoglycan DD-metalloendopeptidase family protein [Verrucomicrobiota bacterium]